MFDLEREIASWRSELVDLPDMSKDAVDELESHLRDSVEELSRTIDIERAFRESVQRLGQPTDLVKEFEKDVPVRRADWVMMLGIASLFLWSLFISLNTFYRFHSEVAEVIKWYFVIHEVGTHIAHIAGGFGMYYIIRYMVLEREEISFNRLFIVSNRTLLPIAALFIWTAVAIYVIGRGPIVPFHEISRALLVMAPLVVLPICWSKRLRRVHIAQFVVLFWAAILLAINLKDYSNEDFEMMVFLFGFTIVVAALPSLHLARIRKARASLS